MKKLMNGTKNILVNMAGNTKHILFRSQAVLSNNSGEGFVDTAVIS